ncbi:MAG: chain-length determining protein [Bacteroidales bacterium]|nr:chain-length determining protein [Bacteroidales bacterium]MDD5989607.1 chain-length determining protein [Bacteroidales bacterium]
MDEKKSSITSLVKDEIRLDIIAKIIWRYKKKFILPVFATCLGTYLFLVCLPRYYSATVKLAPESTAPSMGGGGLSSLASSFGVNIGNMNTGDAIIPEFYPDLMESTDFIVPLFYVQVETKDGAFKGPFVEYLTKVQPVAWWERLYNWTKNLIKKPDPLNTGKDYKINPFQLNKTETEVVKGISGSVRCDVDKKTDVISITTTARDPLVAAQLADSVKVKLQQFIINYRTEKARGDVRHYAALCEQLKVKYDSAKTAYADYVDAHRDLILQSYKTEEVAYENELQNAYSAYSSVRQQLQLAESKLQERTPSFTVIQNATVPVKPAGPKRMFNSLAMAFLAFIIVTVWLIMKHHKEYL